MYAMFQVIRYFSYLFKAFKLLINYHFVTLWGIEILNNSPRVLNFVYNGIVIVETWIKFGSQIRTDFRIRSRCFTALPSSPDRRFIKIFRSAWINSIRRTKTSTKLARRFLQKIKYYFWRNTLSVRDIFVI